MQKHLSHYCLLRCIGLLSVSLWAWEGEAFCSRSTCGVQSSVDALVGQPMGDPLEVLASEWASLVTEAEREAAATALAPIVGNSFFQEAFLFQALAYDAIASRLRHSLAQWDGQEGYTAGDWEEWCDAGYGRWMKIVGGTIDQKDRHGVMGYKGKMAGIVLGMDASLPHSSLLGVTVSYGHADLSHHASSAKTRSHTYQLGVYGAFEFCKRWYAQWVAEMAYDRYGVARQVQVGDLYLHPRGRFHGMQWGVQGELGYDWQEGALHVIPLCSLWYTHWHGSTYTEKNAGNAGQTLSARDADALRGGVGVRVAYYCPARCKQGIVFQPEVRVDVLRDFVNDTLAVTARWIGEGTFFVAEGARPSAVTTHLGTGFSLWSAAVNYVVSFQVDVWGRQDYTARTGFIRLRYEW